MKLSKNLFLSKFYLSLSPERNSARFQGCFSFFLLLRNGSELLHFLSVSNTYILKWGALIFRAEIIPFEPARVIPRRE